MAYRILFAPALPGWEEQFYSINREWLEEFFSVTPADESQLLNPQRILKAGGAILFVMDGDQPVGTAALIVEQDGSVELAKMGVLKSYRGRGAGSFLMAALIDEAKRITTGVIYLETVEVLTAAIALYERTGFVRAGAPHTHPQFGRTTFRMELQERSRLG
ncbi:MAG: hypothetical protein RL021_1840 [Bacteroidota bacterium]|jgi:GNAT superfamily N-acetyltransferase